MSSEARGIGSHIVNLTACKEVFLCFFCTILCRFLALCWQGQRFVLKITAIGLRCVHMLSRLSMGATRAASRVASVARVPPRVAIGVVASAACGTAAAATCDNSNLHLKYFDARGVVETTRIMMESTYPPHPHPSHPCLPS